MATDTARVQLELASGRNEVTAPYHQTAQRRRKQLEPEAASVGAPAPTEIVIDAPLPSQTQSAETPALPRELAAEQLPPGTARPPWIAFIAALIAVAVAVWWVMSQRMPDIDPREVIARNLTDAQAAMADGRYTDPPERSAFHYYNAVLALDPDHADAIAGIDAIAERHLTDARVLLSKRKIAEAGVALEKARRVRPEHDGLATLDKQWRAELRTLLAASTAIGKPTSALTPRPTVAKSREAIQRSIGSDEPEAAARLKIESSAPPKGKSSAPEVKNEPVARSVAQPRVADLAAATAVLATTAPSGASTAALPASEPQTVSAPAEVTSIVEETVVAAAPPAAAAGSSEPKLIKMVEPAYPQEALIRGLEGWVDVSLQVSPSGDVLDPRVEESSRGRMFNRAALNAVQQWKYEPRGAGASSERVRVRLQFQQSAERR